MEADAIRRSYVYVDELACLNDMTGELWKYAEADCRYAEFFFVVFSPGAHAAYAHYTWEEFVDYFPNAVDNQNLQSQMLKGFDYICENSRSALT